MAESVVVEKPDYSLDLNGNYSNEGVNEFLTSVFVDTLQQKKQQQQQKQQRPLLVQLKGGITNVLLKGTIGNLEFLIRAYGKGTSTIINRDREYATHKLLESLGLAPDLYCRFANGLIYGYVPGASIHYTWMSNVDIMKGVSNRLGQWHSLLDESKIELFINDSGDYSKDLWQLLDKWLDTMPSGVLNTTAQELKEEIAWIQKTIGHVGTTVVGHCDLLSGNIIVPPSKKYMSEEIPATSDNSSIENLGYETDSNANSNYKPSELVSFIDYEYTIPAPRGFDLANHFMEWQGFDCRTELIPKPSTNNPVLRYWCYHYLSSTNVYTKRPNVVTESKIDELISEIRTWWGVPGLYWGVWAAIQSSISEIDFDYASYAVQRLSEYYDWKQNIYPTL